MFNLRKNKHDSSLLHFYIIDNDTSFTNKLSRSLNTDPDYKIDVFYDKEEFLEKYNTEIFHSKKEKIHIVIIDADQIAQPNDFQLFQTIKKTLKNTEIVVLTNEDDSNFGSDAFKSGVYSIIPKNDNVFYRIENSAKGIKSLKIFLRKRKTMKVAFLVFIIFVVIMVITFLVVWFNT